MEPGAAGRRWQRQSQGGVGARTLSPPSTPEPGRIRRGSLALPPRARAPSRRLARRLEAGAAGSGAAQGPARGRAAARTSLQQSSSRTEVKFRSDLHMKPNWLSS
ncbi:unnamed protein product [Lepidochelys olivacea]